MVSEPLFDYYDIHLTGHTVVVEEPERDSDDEPTEYELDYQ